MSTQGQEKTDRNFVSENGRTEVEFVKPDYQSSIADLEEGAAPSHHIRRGGTDSEQASSGQVHRLPQDSRLSEFRHVAI